MTSLEIADVTGKPHNDVLKAIRKMEDGWKEVAQGNFTLSSYKDPTGRILPCYSLTKTECLYVATKFNDVARARLVLRWEELERGVRSEPQRLLVTEKEILQQGDAIRRQQIAGENLPSDGCMTAGEVARMLEMEVKDLNKLLVAAGVQFWNGGRYYSLEGEKKRRYYLVSTTDGAEMIRDLINN